MEENFKVPYTKIIDIIPHSNANKLEIAIVYGFHCIVSKGEYKAGDEVFYVPIDSVIPQKLEDFYFPPGSKIDRSSAKRRIRQIRIRSVPSQGMILSLKDARKVFDTHVDFTLEQDYATLFEIEKYEPPVQIASNGKPGQPRDKKHEHPLFHQYNGLLNVKWFPAKFRPDEMVEAQEKLHGTNARASLLPYNANTWWKKFKRFFGFTPATEFCYGSNCVQLQDKGERAGGFYKKNVYREAFELYEAEKKLKVGETIYGEIIGWAGPETLIQKKYTYGVPKGNLRFVLFDVKVTENGKMRWLNPIEVRSYAHERGFDMVPTLYRGPFYSMEHMKQYSIGESVYDPQTKVREGCVIKSIENYDECGNKRALKFISEIYLDSHDNSDDH